MSSAACQWHGPPLGRRGRGCQVHQKQPITHPNGPTHLYSSGLVHSSSMSPSEIPNCPINAAKQFDCNMLKLSTSETPTKAPSPLLFAWCTHTRSALSLRNLATSCSGDGKPRGRQQKMTLNTAGGHTCVSLPALPNLVLPSGCNCYRDLVTVIGWWPIVWLLFGLLGFVFFFPF